MAGEDLVQALVPEQATAGPVGQALAAYPAWWRQGAAQPAPDPLKDLATGTIDPRVIDEATMMAPIHAYHGSPHDFDAFDLSKIGTGEGFQAYGHGLYFAENPAVARDYRERLAGPSRPSMLQWEGQDVWPNLRSYDPDVQQGLLDLHARMSLYKNMADPAILERTRDSLGRTIANYESGAIPMDAGHYADAKAALRVMDDPSFSVAPPETPGHMYEVQINAEPHQLLDWDRPLSEQNVPADPLNRVSWMMDRTTATGGDLYRALSAMSDKPGATDALRQAGIPGIRYLDAMSRAADDGTRNLVVFDPARIQILKKYGLAPVASGGGLGAALAGQGGDDGQ